MDKRNGFVGLVTLCAAAVMMLSAAAGPVDGQAVEGDGYQGVDWPNWRGPNHDGISPETGWNQDWSGGGPPIAWKANIGLGFSSFAVVGNRVYAMGNKNRQETVYCFHADTGEKLWTHRYEAKLINKLHEGGPSATPTVHDGRVYTLGKQGHTFCLDAMSGKVIWRADMQQIAGLKEAPKWGFSSSGLVQGETVIFQVGPTVALDLESGEVVWKSKRYAPAYGTPAPFQWQGTDMVASLNTAGLSIMKESDGTEVSFYPWETKFDTNATTPIIHDGKVFLSTGYKKGCALLKLKRGQPERVYRKKRPGQSMSNHINTAVLYEGHLYGFDGNTHRNRLIDLMCMAFDSGREKWRHRGLGAGSLLISEGKLVILSDEGELVLADATPSGYHKLASKKVLEGKCWTVPVLAHGRIYCRNARGDMVCVDVRGGQTSE